jgi:hypothetical protein
MIANLRKGEASAANKSPALEMPHGEAAAITERAYCDELEQQRDPAGRRLRNWLIAANAVAWVAIIAGIHLIFF